MAEDKNNFLPADWKDNDRMNFMFSAFPESREVNPKHWDSKLHFWTKLILDSCRLESNDGVCIDLATLQRRFSRNGLTPLGLNTVINEMVKEGKLQRKEDFVKCGSEGWMAWSFGLAKKSFWWGTRTVFGGDANDGGDNGQFVVVNLAKEKANWILAQHYKKADDETVDCVIPWNVLKAQCSCDDHVRNDDTLELLISALQKQGKVALFTTSEGEKVVKLARKGQQCVDPVSQTDVEIMRVRKTMANLTLRARKLTNEIERLKAVSLAKEGSRRMALKLLKKKQLQQKALEETLSSLNSLEEILQRIQSGKTNQMVFEALKSGTVALKGTQEEFGIDAVDDVMDELNETLNRSEDIHAAISEGNARIAETSGVGDEELEDLERELASLAIGNKDAVSAMQPATSQDDKMPTALPGEVSPIPKQSSRQPFVGFESNGSTSRLSRLPDTPKEIPDKVKGPGTKDLSRQLNPAQLVG